MTSEQYDIACFRQHEHEVIVLLKVTIGIILCISKMLTVSNEHIDLE